MKALKYFSNKIEILKKLNAPTKSNIITTSFLELPHPPLYQEDLEEVSTDDHKCNNILLSQMYSEENETLFI